MRPRRLSKTASSPAAVSHCYGRRKRSRISRLVGDEPIGVKIIARAIEEPMRWIAANAGHERSIVVQRVRELAGDEGFNTQTER